MFALPAPVGSTSPRASTSATALFVLDHVVSSEKSRVGGAVQPVAVPVVAASVAVAVSCTGVPITAASTLAGATLTLVTLSGVPCTTQRFTGEALLELTTPPTAALMTAVPVKIRNDATTGPPKSDRPK